MKFLYTIYNYIIFRLANKAIITSNEQFVSIYRKFLFVDIIGILDTDIKKVFWYDRDMRVIIAGSRTITDLETVVRCIEESGFELREVVSGTAKGVDQLGEQWARALGIPIARFPADWETHGKRAGYLRNIDMGEYADALIAVWDGESKGTKHMIDIMNSLNKPVYIGKPSKWDKIKFAF